MEENKEQKISFLTRLKWAIFNVENYDFFAVEKIHKAFVYFIKLLLIFTVIICIPITYIFGNYYKRTVNYIINELPNFTYENGKLNVEKEETITKESKSGIVIIDTTITSETEEAQELVKKVKTYQSGIVLLNDRAIIKLPTSEQTSSYLYNEIINYDRIEKWEVTDYINSIPVESVYIAFYIISIIYLFSIYFIIILMDVILLSILGVITSRILGMKLRYLPIFNISIYALTLPILLNAIYIIVNTLTGFEIQYFQIMYNAISYIYLVTAILMIKSEMIKQQIELMKLEEEQKKVKEELEKQKEEEEQKQREKDDEKKQEQNDESEGEPEGSSAS